MAWRFISTLLLYLLLIMPRTWADFFFIIGSSWAWTGISIMGLDLSRFHLMQDRPFLHLISMPVPVPPLYLGISHPISRVFHQSWHHASISLPPPPPPHAPPFLRPFISHHPSASAKPVRSRAASHILLSCSFSHSCSI